MRPAAAVYRWCQRWGIPLALLGVGYFAAGAICVSMVQTGGPGWWYLGMATCWWSALKLVGHGLFATIKLPIARASENLAVSRVLREERRTARDQGKLLPIRTRDEHLRLTDEVRADMIADRDVPA